MIGGVDLEDIEARRGRVLRRDEFARTFGGDETLLVHRDIPALIALVREQRAEIDRLRALVGHMEFPRGY